MKEKPETGFMCGPGALLQILRATGTNAATAALAEAKSTLQGFSLAQVRKLSEASGLNYQIARRKPGARVVLNSVIHWKLDHFGAVLKAENGRYLVQDPTFGQLYGQELWVT